MDAVAPLVYLVEETQKGAMISDQVADAAKTALSLQETSPPMSKKAILALNKKVHCLVEEEEVRICRGSTSTLSKVFERRLRPTWWRASSASCPPETDARIFGISAPNTCLAGVAGKLQEGRQLPLWTQESAEKDPSIPHQGKV